MLLHKGIQTAVTAFQSGNILLAKTIADELVKKYSDNSELNMLLAAIYAAESKYEKVVRLCERVLCNQPDNAVAAYNAAVAADKLSDYKRVIYFTDIILSNNKTHQAAILLRVSALYGIGDIAGAIETAVDFYFVCGRNEEFLRCLDAIFVAHGGCDVCGRLYDSILSLSPEDQNAMVGIARFYIREGDYDRAASFIQKIDMAGAFLKKRIALTALLMMSKGMYNECIKYVEGYTSNIGGIHAERDIWRPYVVSLRCVGNNRKALKVLERVLLSGKSVSECYHEMGVIHDAEGNIDAAINAYLASLRLQPDSVPTLYNLAYLWSKRGDRKKALEAIGKCYKLDKSIQIKSMYVDILSSSSMADLDIIDEQFLRDVIRDDDVDPQSLSGIAWCLVKRDMPFVSGMEGAACEGDVERYQKEFTKNASELLGSDLLRDYYSFLQITSYSVERFSTSLRYCLAILMGKSGIAKNYMELCCALAIRNYISGYLSATSDKEAAIVRGIIQKYRSSGEVVSQSDSAILGMYGSLYDLKDRHGLKFTEIGDGFLYNYMIKMHIKDRELENDYIGRISCLNEVDNEVSVAVKSQYESSPYPVWQRLTKRKPETLSHIMRTVSPFLDVSDMPTDVEVLVAGCGTGSHVLQTAMRIKHESIIAIDLSRRSMAFAMRKAVEYNIDSISFFLLDILDVDKLDKRFDVIESVGVLHHMDDPLEGLRRLVRVLRPNGLLNVGLYSKIGRRHIIKAKSIYDPPSRTVSDDELREIRLKIICDDDKEMVDNIMGYKDFYTLYDCRDLLFHENEYNFDLVEISNMLCDVGLEFVGFDLHDRALLGEYMTMFPDDRGATSLENWSRFEEVHPDAFSSMYVFWCRKPDKSISH